MRAAFVHREAQRLGATVLAAVSDIASPRERLLAAVRGVRSNPTLAVWFSGADTSIAAQLASSSAVIEAIATSFLGETDAAHARWAIRIVLSLLALPGGSEHEERTMLERSVAPVLLPTPAAPD